MDVPNVHPNSPSFLVSSSLPEEHLTMVIQTIIKAKRIVVVCGAGISVEAGIPDFRSQHGLFQSLKRDNPKESLSSGKDLFDTSVFKSKQKTVLFYRMIARLSSLSAQGQPTAFHRLLRVLNDRGQLLRVYTQNIDALEMKAGLSFGVPVFDEKKLRPKIRRKANAKAKESGNGTYNARLGGRKGFQSFTPTGASTSSPEELGTPSAGPSTPPRRITPTEADMRLNVIPRCIPLHGTLLTLHCEHCTQSFPLRAPSYHSAPLSRPSPPNSSGEDVVATTSLHSMLAHGMPPPCPSCTSLEETRALVGKRLRGVGRLRPSVVLYGEEHREGEGVGEVVRRDLCGITDAKVTPATPEKADAGSPNKSRVRMGKGPDLLLVVGTSLRVPGTKRIVREFSKAVRQPVSQTVFQLPTPTSSPPAADRIPAKTQTVYINFDFPSPAREWEGVFDVWVNGDVQEFAKSVEKVLKDEEAKKVRKDEVARKARRESSPAKSKGAGSLTTHKGKLAALAKPKQKRKQSNPETPSRPAKRRKTDTDVPPTPVSLPRPSGGRPGRQGKSHPPSPNTIRKVILRLPRLSPPLKRRLSIPEVVITRETTRFSRKSLKARSLSPSSSLPSTLTSLSKLTPPPSEAIPPGTVEAWRRNVGDSERTDNAHQTTTLEELSDGDLALAVFTARQGVNSRFSRQGRFPIK